MFVTNFNQQAAVAQYQLQQQGRQQHLTQQGVVLGQPQSTEAGTLYIADNFEASASGAPLCHGQLSHSAALSTGYRGPIELRDFPRARYVMFDPSAPPQSAGEAYLEQLRRDTGQSYQQVLRPATDQLQQLSEAGAHNSVLNISKGSNPFDVAAIAYFQIRGDASQRSAAAEAFGLDEKLLSDADINKSGPERARLQQALLATVQQTVDTSPAIQQARQDYTEAVQRFTSQHNSVVVAGGNSGTPLEMLEKDTEQPTRAPAEAFRSALDTTGVVVVGATSGEGSTRPADYSRVHSNNQIYASGEVVGDSGSSFAAPRVGAALAALHAQHPEEDSQQVLALLKEKFTLSGEQGQPPVLDAVALRQALEKESFQGAQGGWLLHP